MVVRSTVYTSTHAIVRQGRRVEVTEHEGFYKLNASADGATVALTLDRGAADALQKELEALLTLSEIAASVT